MAIKKLRLTTTVEYVLDIEIDTDTYNDEFIKDFESYMYDLPDGIESLALHAAHSHLAHGEGHMIEGIGWVTRNGKLAYPKKKEAAPGINIIPIQDEFEPGEWEVQKVEG
jgi:hypothetical protein